jgi:hypothetical protein
MDRHETKARYDALMNEWKANLDVMRAKAEAAPAQARVGYVEKVGQLQKQFDGLKIQAAAALDDANDARESVGKDMELAWEEWVVRAKSEWDELTK